MGVSGRRHALAALLPPGKGPPVPVRGAIYEHVLGDFYINHIIINHMKT
jgi:hypothetical protein